jgi:hypothetical protein
MTNLIITFDISYINVHKYVHKSNRRKLRRSPDPYASISKEIIFATITVRLYDMICWTLLFSLYFLEQKINFLEFKMSNAIFRFNFPMQKKMKLRLPWAICKPRSKLSRYISPGAFAELFFLWFQGLTLNYRHPHQLLKPISGLSDNVLKSKIFDLSNNNIMIIIFSPVRTLVMVHE